MYLAGVPRLRLNQGMGGMISKICHCSVVRFLSILTVILIPITACGESGQSMTSEEIHSTPSIEEMTADNLDAYYEQDKVAGDEKYKGQIVTVSGVVYTIESSYIILEGYGMRDVSGVYCYYNASENAAVTSMKEGQRVRIKGLVRGQDLMNGVDLRPCVIL